MPDIGTPRRKMELSETARDLARQVARHEAGHYVVGRALGFRMGGIHIQIGSPLSRAQRFHGHAEINTSEAVSNMDGVASFLERRVQVLFAGALSEAMDTGTGEIAEEDVRQILDNGGASDEAKARELINLLRNIRHGSDMGRDDGTTQLQGLYSDLIARSAQTVSQERKLIEGLAQRLAGLVEEPGVAYKLSEDDINSTRAFQARFSS